MGTPKKVPLILGNHQKADQRLCVSVPVFLATSPVAQPKSCNTLIVIVVVTIIVILLILLVAVVIVIVRAVIIVIVVSIVKMNWLLPIGAPFQGGVYGKGSRSFIAWPM